jgi:hypothetical protein
MAFPEIALVRRYDAEFAMGTAVLTSADNPENRVQIGGVDHYIMSGTPLMTSTPTELKIIVPPGDGGGYIAASPTCAGGDYWWERLDGPAAFELCGAWVGTIHPSGDIDGTIAGAIGYYSGTGPNWKTDLFCRAGDHRFTMVKR